MAAAKKVRTAAGTSPPPPAAGANPAVPLNQQELYEAIVQLQRSLDELVVRFHAHTHSALDTAIIVGQRVAGGAGVASPNLFTTD